jgi:hypothetical protein
MNVMRKRVTKLKKQKAKPEGIFDVKSKATDQSNDKEKVVDFGGLPERDFKKNLGCG